jgi:formamidopyrimidine-DNA glycosylase
MPEMIEVEFYRRLAERAIGRRIASVEANDRWFCKGATTPEELSQTLESATILQARRVGKLLLLDFEHPRARVGQAVLGLRFGMTGRLIVDNVAAIDELLYSSDRNLPEWDRFRIHFADGGVLAIRDPRRLGGVELDPNVANLGVDALSITSPKLATVLQSTRALKAVLLDQEKIAGIGNLLADEILWRANLLPSRPACCIESDEVKLLSRTIRLTIRTLMKRGGSHMGDVMPHRCTGGRCPRDGSPMLHSSVGGRSTWWCATHQK